jgi:Flp pilus assembly protein TadG
MKSLAKRIPRPRGIRETGAVAVEFALILPIFLALVLGIAEMGRAFNIQVSLSEAARQASRYAAVHCSNASYTPSSAQAAGVAAAPSVALTNADIVIAYTGTGTCAEGNDVSVSVSYTTTWMTGFPNLIPGLPAGLSVQGKGVMRCNG